MKEFGVSPPTDVFTHCRRELCHAVIELILKGEFAEAYKHGILITFPDGIMRRVFPWFYCYSADYPEKSVESSYRPSRSLLMVKQGIARKHQEPGPMPLPTLHDHAERG